MSEFTITEVPLDSVNWSPRTASKYKQVLEKVLAGSCVALEGFETRRDLEKARMGIQCLAIYQGHKGEVTTHLENGVLYVRKRPKEAQ